MDGLLGVLEEDNEVLALLGGVLGATERPFGEALKADDHLVLASEDFLDAALVVEVLVDIVEDILVMSCCFPSNG